MEGGVAPSEGKEITYSAICKRKRPEVSVMIVSKLTTKSRTTIPKPIRTALDLELGDQLSYEILVGRVMIAKVQHGTVQGDDPFRTFDEWHSEEDTAAYADL